MGGGGQAELQKTRGPEAFDFVGKDYGRDAGGRKLGNG